MSDHTAPEGLDCPIHTFLECLQTAQEAYGVWVKAQADVDSIHPLDNQFRSNDLRGRLKAARASYDTAREALGDALDETLPSEVFPDGRR